MVPPKQTTNSGSCSKSTRRGRSTQARSCTAHKRNTKSPETEPEEPQPKAQSHNATSLTHSIRSTQTTRDRSIQLPQSSSTLEVPLQTSQTAADTDPASQLLHDLKDAVNATTPEDWPDDDLETENREMEKMLYQREEDEEEEAGYTEKRGPGHATEGKWNPWEVRLLAAVTISIDPYTCHGRGESERRWKQIALEMETRGKSKRTFQACRRKAGTMITVHRVCLPFSPFP